MSRHTAREQAFQLLYAYEIQKDDFLSQRDYFTRAYPLNDDDLSFFSILVDGVTANKKILDDLIRPRLVRWELSRLPLIDLTLLRLATFEMVFLPDVPTAAAINESVLLAKKYTTDDSRVYINAVLGTIARMLEEDGVPADGRKSDSQGNLP
jgi:N utilization substance protein B